MTERDTGPTPLPAARPGGGWPSGPQTSPPDLDRSWMAWVDAAERAGEPALALALLELAPAGPSGRRAENLVILGREHEAAQLLQSAGVVPAAGRRARTYEELVLAATDAALGDGNAWRWYLTALTELPDGLRTGLRDLTRAVADRIGDVATADGEAAALVDLHGSLHTATWVRSSAAEVINRRPSLSPAGLAELCLHVAQAAGRVGSRVPSDPRYLDGEVESRPLVDLVRAVVARGDVAVARLLVEAFRLLHGTDADLAAVRRELEPRRAGRLVTGALLGVLAVVAGIITSRVVGSVGAVGAVTGLLVVLALDVVVQRPGLSKDEKAAWRVMHSKRVNRAAHTWREGSMGRRFGINLGVLVGAVVTGTAVQSSGTWLVRTLGLPVSDRQLWIWSIAAVPVAVVLLGLGVRAVLAHRDRAAARALFASVVQDVQRSVSHCQCADVSWLSRGRAACYARDHLRPDPDESAAHQVAQALAPAAVRGFASGDLVGPMLMRCSQTDVAWLVGPLAAGGVALALRGVGPAEVAGPAEPQPGGADAPLPGMYL